MSIYRSNGKVLNILIPVILLSLISCTSNSSSKEPISVITSTPSIIVSPTEIKSPTPSSPITDVILSATEASFHIPDGRILFEAYNNKGGLRYSAIKILDVKSAETTQIVEAGQDVNGQVMHLIHPNMTWSPNGHFVAFIGNDIRTDVWIYGYQDIFVVKADGNEVRRLTYSPQYDKHYLSWSPVEKYILTAMGKNGSSDIFLVSADNGEIIKRLTSSGRAFMAAWSPDGKSVAYVENSNLFIMNLDTMASHLASNLPESDYWGGISWSPNTNKIAFSASDANTNCGDIYIFDLITNKLENITSTNYDEASPNWLPYGNYLAFTASSYICGEAVDTWDIYITNLTDEEQLIISKASFLTSVAWAPVPNLEIDKQYVITELGTFLNLRAKPSLSGQIIEKIRAGEVVTVLEGFVDADNYYWWKIRTLDGTEGWAVEVANWYEPASP